MKNKNAIIITIIVAIVAVLSCAFYFVFTKEDENTTLSLADRRWIESNKNKVFDVAIVNNVPVFNYKGNGVFFDFINSIESDTKLDFNPIAYNYGSDVDNKYAFKITRSLKENDLLIYKDNYVLVGNIENKYNNLNSITDVTIGVFEDENDLISKYINTDVSFKSYKTIDELISAVMSSDDEETSLEENDEQSTKEVDLIAIPKMVYLEKIISEEKLNIVYNITDLEEYYVLSLGNDERLNSIINKYFTKWYQENYYDAYKKYLNSNYFIFKGIDDTEKANLKSKEYVYGFVDNAPYDLLNKDKLVGINSSIVKEFTDLVGAELRIEKYENIKELLLDFNGNELDFIFNNYEKNNYKMDVLNTTSIYDEKVVVISNIKNDIVVNSLESIKKLDVLVVDETKIFEHLTANENNVKKMNNLTELLQNIKDNDIAVIDYDTYYYYSKTKLKDFKIDYTFNLDTSYSFTMRDVSNNKLFNDYFDFYLSFVNEKSIANNSYVKLFEIKEEKQVDKIFISLLSLVVILLITIVILKKILFSKKKKRHNPTMSKADKLRYIDVLTSLKNRNYLNDNIEIWDENEVYPQTVVVIDLNNIAYINDNYGHQEGDNVIKDAANILIKNQLENTEIIRTNGNEFLIYMIGYEEKQVVSYLRKINKELKDLAHGFGAASGYSMITDAIKTIDDAVNEATLDMRNNKEELNN